MQRPEVSDQMIIDMILAGVPGVDIAEKYGFTDATVIYRVRRSTGKKPSELRREHGWYGVHIPPEEVEKIVKLYNQTPAFGEPATKPTFASVARETGHTPETIKRVLKSRGVDIGEPGRRSYFTVETKQQIVNGYVAGHSCPDLAEQYGVNEITIRRTLKAMGVSRRPRGRPPGKRETPTATS